MTRNPALRRNLPVLLLLTLVAVSGLVGAPLQGRWRLVEQRYESGEANLAAKDTPLLLEFYLDGAKLAGRIRAGEKNLAPVPWPAFHSETGAHPVQVEEFRITVEGDRVRTVYRVDPPAGGNQAFRIEEDYRVVENGRALVGTVRVTALRDGRPEGSYLLHRRFEREP